MATQEELTALEQALIAADAAGNDVDAQALADELHRLTSEAPEETGPMPGMTNVLLPLGAGLVKGAVLTPAEAVAKMGARGAFAAGLISEEQLQAFSQKLQGFETQYEETFHPSGVGEFVGSLAIPIPGSKVQAVSTAGKWLKPLVPGAVFGGMTEAARGDVDSPDYWSRTGWGSALGAGAGIVIGGVSTALSRAIAGAARSGYKFANKTAPQILEDLGMGKSKIRALYKAAENDPAKFAAELRKVDKHPLPGYQPTAAEKTVGLETALLPGAQAKLVGEAATEYTRRGKHNITAMKDALRSLFKSDRAILDAVKEREQASTPFYDQFNRKLFQETPELKAFFSGPTGRRIASAADRLVGDMRSRGLKVRGRVAGKPAQEVSTGILDKAGNEVRRVTEETPAIYSGQWLSAAREALRMKIKEDAAKNVFDRETVAGKDALTKYLESLAPDTFGEGINTFRELSIPINQMQTARELYRSFSPSEGTTISAAAFRKAMSDVPKLLKKSTGQARFNQLEEVLSPEQLSVIQAVEDKVAKKELVDYAATHGRQAEDLVRDKQPWLANFLNPIFTVAHSIKKASDEAVADRVSREMAVELLYPEKMAEAFDQAVMSTRAWDALRKGTEKVGGAGTQAFLDWQRSKETEAQEKLDEMAERYRLEHTGADPLGGRTNGPTVIYNDDLQTPIRKEEYIPIRK